VVAPQPGADSKPGIVTKGVESHRSPVTTLNLHRPEGLELEIKHSDFVNAVTEEFATVYAAPDKPIETVRVKEREVSEAKVWDGVKELKSWEWTYGQTPEFTNDIGGVGSVRNLVRDRV
jgi:lipoate-protein ligase A